MNKRSGESCAGCDGQITAALAFARLEVGPELPALRGLRTWLGSWRGVGPIAEAMGREG